MRSQVLVLLGLCLALSLEARAQGKIETIGAFSDAAASEAIRGAVSETGYRVTLADGSVLCEIWLRKELPAKSGEEIPGAVFTQFGDSALVGVMSFPKPSQDYRGQPIKAGAYTLRYGLHPTDGNHMGISPYRDFLLLVPIALDQDPAAVYKFDDLMKMSAKTNGSNHPSPISLVMTDGANAPALTEGDHGHIIFIGKINLAGGGDVPIGMVVKGVAEQ